MDTSKIKLELFRTIDKLSDERLKELYKLLKEEEDSDKDFWEALSAVQKKDIEEGIKDLDEGRAKNLGEVLSKYN